MSPPATSKYTPSSSGTLTIDARIPAFFTSFYASSDDPSSISDWVTSYFTPDAHLTMGTRSATGHDAILALRQANWAGPVKSRRHVVERVYPFGTSVSSGDGDGEEGKKGDDALEVFLNGTVEYGLKNGRDVTIEWAAKAVFVEVSVDGGEDKASGLRFKFYQVYLDSAPLTAAAQG